MVSPFNILYCSNVSSIYKILLLVVFLYISIRLPCESFHSLHPFLDFPITIQPAPDGFMHMTSSCKILSIIFALRLIDGIYPLPVLPQTLPFSTLNIPSLTIALPFTCPKPFILCFNTYSPSGTGLPSVLSFISSVDSLNTSFLLLSLG